MPELDPGIQMNLTERESYVKLCWWHGLMDCRVKPGNDDESRRARVPGLTAANFNAALRCR